MGGRDVDVTEPLGRERGRQAHVRSGFPIRAVSRIVSGTAVDSIVAVSGPTPHSIEATPTEGNTDVQRLSPPRPRAFLDARRRRLCGFLVADTGHADSSVNDGDVGSGDIPGHDADIDRADRVRLRRDLRGRGAFPRLDDGAHRSHARHRRRERRDGGADGGAVGGSGPRRLGARACRPADQRPADLRPGAPDHADRLGDQPSLGAKLVAVKTAIEQIKTAGSAVESALATSCPAN